MESNDKVSKSTIKRINKMYQKALDDFANEVSFQVESAYENVISLFYADYGPNNGEPWYYNRTHSTYLASNGHKDPFSPTNVRHLGDTIMAGIEVDSSNIPGHPYRADTGWVFDRTFYKGIHGISRQDVRSRNEIIRQRYRNAIRTKKLLSSKHKTLQIDITMKGLIKRVPKNMTPPPKRIMDKEFKNLTKKRNLDNMFNDIFSKSLYGS
ncbi:MAG: hypothetical protein IJ880_06295 [Bacilli bacterium]|nr:hypothetical protein [Bacilli bacterium]